MAEPPLQQVCLGVIVGSPILAAMFVGSRIHTRRKLNLRLGWDDWCIVAAAILSLGLIGPSWRHVKMWYIGWHVWEIPQGHSEPNFNDYYALINIPILPLAKASIILLLLRGGGVIPWLKRTLYAILTFTILSSLLPWLIYIFICRPLTGNTWNKRTFGDMKCIGRRTMGEMLIWVTCANLITDVLILPIPFIMVRRLMSARIRSKLVVLAAFFCGLVVTSLSAAKIYLQYRDRLWGQVSSDWTYNINYCISHIENNVAIILANFPILRGLVTRWVFDFRAQGPLPDRGFRASQQLNSYNSSEFGHRSRGSRFIQRFILCEKERFLPRIASTYGNDTPSPLVSMQAIAISRPPRAHPRPKYQSGDPGGFINAYYRARGYESDMVISKEMESLPKLVDSNETIWRNRPQRM
ncbi:hypothetical protein FB567DRAFT_549980 [Paraphoma chrysanthemicola]|uniref:Rhodopsin domain-containing protein n=1 Tax=Paraphoma chrysanthemicola TaxID=798071 RepID=A0A8K0R2Z0_9PLEO|nr:hypothetical protein FB567DRAFT_549980 [Paraphoma chrysanthemicola]